MVHEITFKNKIKLAIRDVINDYGWNELNYMDELDPPKLIAKGGNLFDS